MSIAYKYTREMVDLANSHDKRRTYPLISANQNMLKPIINKHKHICIEFVTFGIHNRK